uniref:Polyprorein 1 n=1 Tax=Goettingen Seco-like virus 2 TaxID=2789613 RepID=A0A7T1LYP5_9SECO|nr:polyprorein 1 [Goettingen Seco-like virus 2]
METVLATFALNYQFVDSFQTPTVDTISFTPLSLVASRFCRIKGGHKFRFRIVSSSIHEGRIIVSFHPHVTDAETGIINATSVKNVTFDFSKEKNVFEWHVPYYSTLPWLDQYWCGLLDNTDPPTPPTFTDFQAGTGPFGTGGYGKIVIEAISHLTATDQVSGFVDIAMEVAGDEYINFQIPSPGWPKNAPAPTVVMQAGEGQPSALLAKAEASAAISSGRVMAYKNYFGGDIGETHLKNLLRRYSRIGRRSPSVPSGFSVLKWPVTPALDFWWENPGETHYTYPESHLAFFSAFYAFWSGSMSYKIMFNTSQNIALLASLTYDPRNNTSYANVPTTTDNTRHDDQFNLATQIENVARNPVLAVSTPFHSDTLQKMVVDGDLQPDFIPRRQFAGSVVLSLDNPGTTATIPYYVLVAGGDTIKLHRFIGSPVFKLPPGSLKIDSNS